ncbi:anaerobic benzoate catabolism transcriptional regulator [Caloramator mitchellensis]|uniref:Anaerobic benzoate catabolism transcriptional regulator n=1 Tax=Caloramator mitchellensis TaxID=908809 RepID=A0A0R3K0T8_CALMK|nr:helix-turn-helix transcriptional regulator [Caloramator mitchellensis]KRQ86533.1 anaerobic benzoate catabolism transcriptional regulator [Caloramator mitchellensis]
MGNKKLSNAWDFINETVDEETKERFELDDILYEIAMKIFDYRMNKGLTQKQLAEILGMKQSMVSKLESGEYNPTIEQLWKISKKLGWKLDVVLEEKDLAQADVWDEITVQNEDINTEFFEKLVKNA